MFSAVRGRRGSMGACGRSRGLNVAMRQRRKDGDEGRDSSRFARRRRGWWWWLKVNVVEMNLGGKHGAE